jgi:hypothetical protein
MARNVAQHAFFSREIELLQLLLKSEVIMIPFQHCLADNSQSHGAGIAGKGQSWWQQFVPQCNALPRATLYALLDQWEAFVFHRVHLYQRATVQCTLKHNVQWQALVQ